jgi:ribosomal protein S25
MSTQGPREKVVGAVELPDINSKEVIGAIRGMKAITPTGVASRFNLKVSVAKKMLDMMENKGLIRLVAQSSNLKVYEMTDSKDAQ